MDDKEYGFCPLSGKSCDPVNCAWGNSGHHGDMFCSIEAIGTAAMEWVDTQYSENAAEASLKRIASKLESGIYVYGEG